VGMGTIMQQTAVLKLRNYSATVTSVLWYSAGRYYTASISGDDSSILMHQIDFKNLYFHTNALHTAMITVLMITCNCLNNR